MLDADIQKGIELAKATEQTCMTVILSGRNNKPRKDQIKSFNRFLEFRVAKT